MPINHVTLGKRLKEARMNCGVTQEAAAEALGVSRTAIIHIEAGNRSISTVELQDLASLYRREVSEFFVEESANGSEPEDVLVALHRLAAEARGKPEFDKEVLRCVQLCREGCRLEALLTRRQPTVPPAYDIPAPMSLSDAVDQGMEIADAERKRLGVGSAPIPDMADLLSCQGIWASGADLPDAMSGLFLNRPDIGLVVLVNFGHSRGRKRFSYAHEFAHALLDRRHSLTVTTKGNASELLEKRANAFAASFLLPKSGVELYLASLNKGSGSRRTIHVYDVTTEQGIESETRTLAKNQEITFNDAALLAAHYRVSYQVAVYRLSDLGYIHRDQVNALIERAPAAQQYLELVGKWDQVAGKPKRTDKNLKGQILALALEAIRRKEITSGRLRDLCQLLSVDWATIRSLI